jgi:NADH:ubiquinone reductase (H+-translocating)
VTVLLAEAARVDLAGHRLVLERGEVGYDALILAAGAGHSYFGHEEWEMFAPGLKTLEDALEIRRRILLAYEDAEREPDGAEQKALLTFVVVGGGPTDVELAGALGEISRQTIARDFRLIDPTRARIVLLESGPRVLGGSPKRCHAARKRRSGASASRCVPAPA